MLWVVMGTGILTVPFTIAQFTIRDGWISCLLFFFGILLCSGTCFFFIKMFPNRNLTEAIIDAFGPIFGTCVGVWLAAWFFVTTSAIVREFVDFTHANLLPKSPPSLLGAVMLMIVGIAVYLGIEVVGRLSEIITLLAIITAIIIIPLTIKNIDFRLLQPTLIDGFSPVFRGAFMPVFGFAVEILVVLQIAPYVTKAPTLWRNVLFLGGIVTLLLTMNQIIIVGTLGNSTNYLVYPVLEVVRSIKIGHFIERLDTLYVLGIITTLFLKMAFFHYCFISIIKCTAKATAARFFIWPATLLILVGSIYLFKTSSDLADYMIYVAPCYFMFTLVFIPLGASLCQLIKVRIFSVQR